MLQNDNLIQIVDLENFNSNSLDTILHKILQHVKTTTNCEAGTIYLKKDNNLEFTIFQNDSFSYEKIYSLQKPIKNMKFQIKEDSEIIAIESFCQSKIIMVEDVYKDQNYNFQSTKEFDKNFDYKTTSILTAPLVDRLKNETIGVVQLINKKDSNTSKYIPFNEEDKKFVSLSSYLIALSIINVQSNIEELEQYNIELEKKIKERTKELLETQIKLQEQAYKDPLTNLYNRRHLDEIKGSLFSMAKRGNSPLSTLILDIDNFKNINDQYGHQIGDLVITTLSNIIINTIRQSDIAIRYGGEEFLVLLTNTNTENAYILAEKIRLNIQNTSVKIKDKEELKFTISLGIAMITREHSQMENSIGDADKALYIAKETGKNKTVSA